MLPGAGGSPTQDRVARVATRKGAKYETANGETILNEGEPMFNAFTEEGRAIQMKLQICDVNDGLLRVSKARRQGRRIVMWAYKSED